MGVDAVKSGEKESATSATDPTETYLLGRKGAMLRK